MDFSFLQRNVPKWRIAASIGAVGLLLVLIAVFPALRVANHRRAPRFQEAPMVLASALPTKQEGRNVYDSIPVGSPKSSRESTSEPIPLPSGLAHPASTVEPMVIRSATMRLTVKDTTAALRAVSGAAADAGGYIADSRLWREQELLRAHIVIRVPARKFDRTVSEARRAALRVDQEQLSGQDVTEEFADLKAQLVNLEATEVELRQLLSAIRQRSQKASEVLAIYRELVTVRGQIERLQGRLQYLGNRVAFATLDIDLIPEVLATPRVEPAWKPLATASHALAALRDAVRWLIDVGTWLVVLVLPLAFGTLVSGKLLLWLLRHRRTRSAS